MFDKLTDLMRIMDDVNIGIVYLDTDLHYRYINSYGAGITDHIPGDLIGLPLGPVIMENFGDDTWHWLSDGLRHVLKTGESYCGHGWSSPQRPQFFADWSVRRVDDPQGNPIGVLLTVVDVSSHMQTELALTESRERFRLATEAAGIGTWEWDIPSDRQIADLRCNLMFGYQPDAAMGEKDFWRSVHPDDRQRVYDEIARSHSHRTDYRVEYRIIRPGGDIRWIQSMGRAFFNGSEKPVRLIGIAIDITDAKLAQQRMLEFYRRTLAAATNGKLIITDKADIWQSAGEGVAAWDIDSAECLRDIREHAAASALSRGMDELRVDKLRLCVGEATTNALKHAVGGVASVHHTAEGITVVVSDRGDGIDEVRLPDVALTPGYSTTDTLGMGYKVMLSFADRIYLATGPGGTTVAIYMGLRPTATMPFDMDL